MSTEEQNLDLQEKLIQAEIPDQIYSDQESGTFSGRTGYRNLCNEIERGGICQVIVYRLDRVSRDPVELIKFFNLLERKHVEFNSLTEPWLTDWNKGPMQFMTWWMQIGMARFELLLLKDRQRRGIDSLQEKIRKGLSKWKGRGPDKKPRKKLRRILPLRGGPHRPDAPMGIGTPPAGLCGPAITGQATTNKAAGDL